MEKWKKRTRPIRIPINEPAKGGIANAVAGQAEKGNLHNEFAQDVYGGQFIAAEYLRKAVRY